jgi:hypothetical protein
VLALLAAVVVALPGRSGDSDKAPTFLVEAADGTTARGPLHELKADWSVRVGDGEGTRVAGGDALSVRQAGRPLPAPAERCLVLANGDRVPADDPPRLDGERVRFRSPGLFGDKEAELPLAALSVVWRAAPDSADVPERFLRRLHAAARKRDAVYLRNGDVLEGLLLGLDAGRAEVEVGKKSSAAPAAQVAAVALSTDGADALRPRRPYLRAVIATPAGDRAAWLSLASAACADGATLEGTTLFGARLRVPLGRVLSLDVCQGKAAYLSDLKPARVETAGLAGEKGGVWPPVADGSADGRDLRLGGSVYPKGLGLHPYTRVTYALGGRYRRFEAVVGLDDTTGRKGGARVRVLAEGRPLNAGLEGELTHRGGPVPVRASVVGVRELTLEVDFGAAAGVQAHVNWADARVVK